MSTALFGLWFFIPLIAVGIVGGVFAIIKGGTPLLRIGLFCFVLTILIAIVRY